MKKLLMIIAVIAFNNSANAQDTSLLGIYNNPYGNSSINKTFILSIGIEPSIPLGNFARYSGFGFGGSLQGEFKPH